MANNKIEYLTFNIAFGMVGLLLILLNFIYGISFKHIAVA